MFASLILYFMFPPQVAGPPPFYNAVSSPVPRNDWPMTTGLSTPFADCHCAGDIYRVGFAEGAASVVPTADFNRDGVVNSQDIYDLLALMYATPSEGVTP